MADEKDGRKPMPVGEGELGSPIPLGGTNLAKILGSVAKPNPNAGSQIKAATAVHSHLTFGCVTGAEADRKLEEAQALQKARFAEKQLGHEVKAGGTKVKRIFAEGDEVMDTVKGKKGVIVKLNVGTSTSGNPMHRLVDSKGNAWRQSVKRLR